MSFLDGQVAALAEGTHRDPEIVLAEVLGDGLEHAEQRAARLATLRAAIDERDASGVAEDGVFNRVRERAGLPPRSR